MRRILCKKWSVVAEKIGGRERTGESLPVMIIRDLNGEVAEIGDPGKRGESIKVE